jgi:MFS family permease
MVNFYMAEMALSKRASLRRVTFAACIGTGFEWYDFFLSATASAVVWPFIYFEYLSGQLAAALSVITFGVTFIARPFGAYIFGHLGDKIGRKSTLISTLVMMGVSTFGIGLTPGYASIGITAPIIIIMWRLIFGIGIGGEYGGAVSWVLEYASKSKWRSVWVGAVQATNPTGIGAAAGTISLLTAYFSRADFLSFGWRIPFVIGGIGLILGLSFRYYTAESLMFEDIKKQKKIERFPASRVLIEYPKQTIFLAFAIFCGTGISAIMLQPYSVSYLVARGLATSLITGAVAIGAFPSIIANMLGGVVAQVIGRKRTSIIAIVAGIIFVFPFFLLIGTLNVVLIYASYTVMFLILGISFGVVGSLASEQYPTRLRYSGTGLSYQIGTLMVGLAILLVSYLVSGYGVIGAWPYIAAVMVGLLMLSLIGVSLLSETKDKELL